MKSSKKGVLLNDLHLKKQRRRTVLRNSSLSTLSHSNLTRNLSLNNSGRPTPQMSPSKPILKPLHHQPSKLEIFRPAPKHLHPNPRHTRKKLSSPNLSPTPKIRTLSNKRPPTKLIQSPKEPILFQSVGSYKSITRKGENNGFPKELNEDSYKIVPDFLGVKNQYFFCVLNGHGVNGHLVSNYVKRSLPSSIQLFIRPESNIETVLQKINLVSKELKEIKQALLKGFTYTNKSLFMKNPIDINFSGTTAISILIRGEICFCANTGDSKAIIGSFKKFWTAKALSTGHKPDQPEEKKRIEAAGGKVEPYTDIEGEFIGPSRVWVENDSVPGLAMSRSLGDFVASEVGVISEPEVTKTVLKREDKFVVIATGGVWEKVSEEECVNIVGGFYKRGEVSSACSELVSEARKRWMRVGGEVDDITAIVVFLNKIFL